MFLTAVLSAGTWLAFVIALYFFMDENEKLECALAASHGRRTSVSHAYLVSVYEMYAIHIRASGMAVLNVVVALIFPGGSMGAAVSIVILNCIAHALLFSAVERCRRELARYPVYD